ncbi:helix-turn-helix transcriptional regulator [Candidatus Saccharibacteria bacterium]|nr:helix-turn-helix transcriptional regulator [Candidatus Saccharibacteria bacterium]
MKDPEFKAEYDALEEEFSLAEEFIKARLERKMSQAELAKKAGMQQEAIARLESFDSNPTRKTLSKVAKALDKKISLV